MRKRKCGGDKRLSFEFQFRIPNADFLRGHFGRFVPARYISKRTFFSLFALFLNFQCAKKALPPSPDRFAPHLKEIAVPNRTSIILTFDEAVRGERFLILAKNETLGIRSLVARESKIIISTTPMKREAYLLMGEIADQLGNLRRLKVRFLGSEKKDTMRPEIKDVSFVKDGLEVIFSEPMDTTHLKFFTHPIKEDEILASWSQELDRLFLKPKGTSYLPYLSLLILPTLTDLEGNRLKRGIAFHEILDTLLLAGEPFVVKGDVIWKEKGLEGAIIFIKSAELSLFALSDALGEFNVKLKSGVYQVIAIYDGDGDGLVDLVSSSDLEVPSEPLFLKMAIPEKKVAIYEYID